MAEYSIDDFLMTTDTGNRKRTLTSEVYGVDHRRSGTGIGTAKQSMGYVFFTRPQLNMQSENLSGARHLSPLLSKETKSVSRLIRGTLDPRLDQIVRKNIDNADTLLKSKLLDNEMAFMPVLGNNLLKLTGWGDLELPLFKSGEGIFKEQYMMVDGRINEEAPITINASFRNNKSNTVHKLLFYWMWYMNYRLQYKVRAYIDYRIYGRLDYNTRIWSLKLDQTNTYVTDIWSSGPAILTRLPVGFLGDYDSEASLVSQPTIDVPFECYGSSYNDPILIQEFNRTVEVFKPSMREARRDSVMTIIPHEHLTLMNNRGYPRINLRTNRLEWWIEKSVLERFVSKYKGN